MHICCDFLVTFVCVCLCFSLHRDKDIGKVYCILKLHLFSINSKDNIHPNTYNHLFIYDEALHTLMNCSYIINVGPPTAFQSASV